MTLYLVFRLGLTERASPEKWCFFFALRHNMFTYIIQYWKWADSNTCVIYLGGTAPLFVVFIYFYTLPKTILMGWDFKENTATPNQEHSNQRQQHRRFKIFFQVFPPPPFQSSGLKASSTSNPKVSKMEAVLPGAIQWNKIISKNKN